MPIYEYRCQQCGEKFDKLVRPSADPQVVTCPRCGSAEVRKAISLVGLSGGQESRADSCAPGRSL